jgi:rod shape-determining protein MreC
MSTNRDDLGIAIRSALLQKGTRQIFSLIFLIGLSCVILFLEYKSPSFVKGIRNLINDSIYRVSSIANSPLKFISYTNKKIIVHIFTQKENEYLKDELEKYKLKDLKVEYLTSQNKIMEKILNNNTFNNEETVLGKVLLDKRSPYLRSIVINQGSKSGIKKGMPVVNGNYLVGRIVETNYLSSRVLLLNDLNSRIPIVVSGSNAQAILTGSDEMDPELEYLPKFYVRENNLEVFTSGKDGIFPAGIPIGKTFIKDNKVKVKLYSDSNQLIFVDVQLVDLNEIFIN